MDYIQKPTTNMHGNRCYKIAESKCLAILLEHGNLVPAASWSSSASSLTGVLCMKQREIHFGVGGTSEGREDLQNHRIWEKIRLAGTSVGHLLQTSLEAGADGCKLIMCLHHTCLQDAGLRGLLWGSPLRHLQWTPCHLSQLPVLYSWSAERNGHDEGFVLLRRCRGSCGQVNPTQECPYAAYLLLLYHQHQQAK